MALYVHFRLRATIGAAGSAGNRTDCFLWGGILPLVLEHQMDQLFTHFRKYSVCCAMTPILLKKWLSKLEGS